MRRRELGLTSNIWIFFLVSLFPMISQAEYSFELIPRISVSEVYDDNIYLQSANEKSDYITTVSPGLSFTMSSLNNSLHLDYSPSWVWYDDEDQNDTVRHSGTLTFGQNLSEHLRFDLTDSYLKSEEPVEETEGVEIVRHSRRTYQRNNGQASLRYLFGPENALSIGYGQSLLKNEDVAVDGGRTQNPFATVTYWFNVKNGMELNYGFTKGEFWREDEPEAVDDHTGHSAGISYIYRFTPRTSGSVGYAFTNRHFERRTGDYKVHDGFIGFDHDFSPYLALNIEGGYFIQDYEEATGQSGLNYDASLVKSFEKGRFTIGGSGGWDEAYLDVERRGFSRYWSSVTSLEYQIMERLSSYAGGSYRWDKDEERNEWRTWQGSWGLQWAFGRSFSLSMGYSRSESNEWETWRGSCGLRWEFLRWFSLALDYSYAERDDDVDTGDYKANRLMLNITANKPFRW